MSQTPTIVEQLDTFGPVRCDTLSQEQARAWCRRLARGRYENFSVLSSLVPADRRDDFAAVYAFCRWADDLGDETGDTTRGRELLDWWRRELEQCFQGDPRHPVFIALAPTIESFELPAEPFHDLIDAFQQDQEVSRYDTWEQLLGYCAKSANPVGHLVLRLCREPLDAERRRHSDQICTALQLVNHFQDVRRDFLDRDRIYLPCEMIEIDDFEARLLGSARQGHAVDRTFLGETRTLIRACCERTWPMFESGAALLDEVGPTTRPLVWLLSAGGQHVLRLIEQWNYETVLHRPRLSKVSRLLLVARAHWMLRRGAGSAAGGAPPA